MQTLCTLDDWATGFAQIQKTTTCRNGPAIELPVGLGLARITVEEPPANWARLELIYPEGVTRDNRDGVPWVRFSVHRDSPFAIWQRLSGRIYGYTRALEKARDRGVLTCP